MLSALTTNPDNRQAPLSTALTTGVVFGVAGFALNWFKLEIYFNFDFIFGSIITMFALMRYGLVTGVTAAFIAASCTWYHWHHVWAIVVLTAEAFCTGLFHRKRSRDPMVNSLVFWLTGGPLLIFLFYQLIMGFPFLSTAVIALKYGLNGIFNTLVAFALCITCSFNKRQQEKLPTFRQIIFVTTSLFVITPIFIIAYFNVRSRLSEQLYDRLEHTVGTANSAQSSVQLWLQRSHGVIQYLAGTSVISSSSLMRKNLDIMGSSMPGFYWYGIVDARGTTKVFSPANDETGALTRGLDLSGRSYIRAVRTKPYPIVTQIIRGEIGVPGPRLILAAPILVKKRYQGAAFGVADLGVLKQLLEKSIQGGDTNVTLVNEKGLVVVSTRTALRPLAPFTLPKNGTLKPISDGVNHWIPDPQSGIGATKRWLSSFYMKEVPLENITGWKLVVEASLIPTLVAVSSEVSLSLAAICILLVPLVYFSRRFSIKISSAVSEFERVTRQLPEKIADGTTIDWPTPSTSELQGLSGNFQLMSKAIRHSYEELRELNTTLEQRVEERTEELKLQQQRLRNIIFGTNIGTWEWNIQTGETAFNERWAEIIGSRLSELQPVSIQTWFDHVHPEDLILSERLLGSHFSGETLSFEFEGRMKHKDGHWVWVLDRGKVVSWTDDGKPLLMSGTHQDITARKQVEDALRNSQELLQALIDTTPDPICVYDCEGRPLLMNHAGLQYFGMASAEVAGNDAARLFPPQAAKIIDLNRKKVLDGGGVVNFEVALPNAHAETHFFNVMIGPIRDAEGATTRIFSIARDITDRIQAEEQLEHERSLFKTIISTIPDLVFLKDTAGTYVACNPAFEAFFGIQESDVIGKTNYAFLPRNEADLFRCRDEEVMKSANQLVSREWARCKKDGHKAFLETVKTPMYGRGGKLCGVLSISRDITVTHQAQEELRRRLSLQGRLKIIADTAPGVLFEYQRRSDGTTCFPYVSASVTEIWGCGPEEVKNDGARAWALVHPEDRTRIVRLTSASEPELDSEPLVTEFRLLSPKGELWVKISAIPTLVSGGNVTWVGFMTDITTYKRAELVLREREFGLKRAVAKRTDDLRRLAERIEQVAEQERAAIAQEIHDDLGQLLATLMVDLAWFQKRAPEGDPTFTKRLTAMHNLLGLTIQCVRRITRSLRPLFLDELGLVAAIESQLELCWERHLVCHITIPQRNIAVDRERSISLFRTFQECMTNILRHSGASRVDILLDTTEERVILQFADNGCGITPAESENVKSLGLLGIRERATRWGGDVNIDGVPGQGTVVRVFVPM